MGLLLFLFFCILAFILIACAIGFSFYENKRRKQVAGMLKTVAGEEPVAARSGVLIQRPDEEEALLRLLRRLDPSQKVQTRMTQAGLEWSMAQFFLAATVLAVLGAVLGLKFNPLLFAWLSPIVLAVAFGVLPYVYVSVKRNQRFAEFEQQFPEALDFLARSMRAGHAFSVSLEMLGEESPEPLGREFRTLFNEQNLGANIEVSLANLVRRVPLIDVRFFVSAVMLQRQTGGNLSEILTRLGYIIRERFRLRGQVKAASAHGRITAGILTLMPIVMTVLLTLIAPEYLATMVHDSDGKYLIMAAVISQLVGYYFIRRIINIKV